MFFYLSSQDQFLLKTHTMKLKHILPLLLTQAWAAARAPTQGTWQLPSLECRIIKEQVAPNQMKSQVNSPPAPFHPPPTTKHIHQPRVDPTRGKGVSFKVNTFFLSPELTAYYSVYAKKWVLNFNSSIYVICMKLEEIKCKKSWGKHSKAGRPITLLKWQCKRNSRTEPRSGRLLSWLKSDGQLYLQK